MNSILHDFLFVHTLPAHLWWLDLIRMLIRALIALFSVLLIVPPLVWFERRLLGFIQQREGPNRVGPGGILQTIADGIKLLMKEDIIPYNVDKTLYIAAPIVMLIPAMVTSGILPWGPSLTWGSVAPNVNIGVLYLLAWSSLGVYGIVLAGWSSNNKYALLGGLRSSAQLISYELGMGLAVLTVVLMTGSLGTTDIVFAQTNSYWPLFPNSLHWGIGIPKWNIFQLFPMGFLAALIYMISMLAETNRAPFDLPEAETELVAGYHTEYTSMKFAIFFMGEYANMVVVSAVLVTLFLGGWGPIIPWLGQLPAAIVGLYHNWGVDWLTMIVNSLLPPVTYVIKIILLLYFFVWVRATLPRLRYDMLMNFGWKGILPLALVNILCVAVALAFDSYLLGVAVWVILAGIALIAVASDKSTKKFTEKTRRVGTIKLSSSAIPFRAVAEHAGRGGQTLPPDALKNPPELVENAESLAEKS